MATLQESIGLPELSRFVERLHFIPHTRMFILVLLDLMEIARRGLKFNADLLAVIQMTIKGWIVAVLPA